MAERRQADPIKAKGDGAVRLIGQIGHGKALAVKPLENNHFSNHVTELLLSGRPADFSGSTVPRQGSPGDRCAAALLGLVVLRPMLGGELFDLARRDVQAIPMSEPLRDTPA